MPREAELRDLLSTRLELLERGLTLINTEVRLPNDAGAKGFVDILARDRHGHLVIIELKVSDASARSAIHEIFKYITLVRSAAGLSDRSIRCIIVSTEWHELLVPFSAYIRCVQYSVDGLRLYLTEDGLPSRVERIVPVPEPQELDLCPYADLLVYGLYGDKGPEQRDEALRELQARAAALGIDDYCLATLDNPDNQGYAATSAICAALSRLTPDKADALSQHTGFDLELYRDDSPEYDWAHEQATLTLWTQSIFRDDMEMCHSRKIGRMLKQEGWSFGRFVRGGRYSDEALVPDHELRSRLLGLDGASPLWYSSSSSPRLTASWEHSVEAARRCLRGNDEWSAAWTSYMDRVRAESPDASVSTYIFNPQNIAFILWEFASGTGRTDILPDLQIATEVEHRPLRLLVGQLEWDGVTHPDDPQHIFGEVFENKLEMPFTAKGLYVLKTFGGLWELDASLVKAHGLRYGLTEVVFDDPGSPTRKQLVAHDDGLREETQTHRTFAEFLEANLAYLARLVMLLDPRRVNQ